MGPSSKSQVPVGFPPGFRGFLVPKPITTQDLFIEKYENSGQPVLIKNAAKEWPALEKFGFEFFKQLYLNLSSPVLKNELDDCEFLSWDFDFKNILVCQKNYLYYLPEGTKVCSNENNMRIIFQLYVDSIS